MSEITFKCKNCGNKSELTKVLCNCGIIKDICFNKELLMQFLEELKELHLDRELKKGYQTEITREDSDIVSCCDYLIERLRA